MWKVEVTKMTSSHRAGGLFTAMSFPDKRTVRRGFICKSIRDLKYNTVFDGDSENISFM